MTQFKDKSSKGGSDGARVGLFTYPMLQAADILLYQADLVPVGEDQRQHIEITRDLANRFNTRYGQVFTLPDAYILKEGAKIYDLQEPTNKMSKSASSASGVIELMDAPEVNVKKIKSAVTDTGREVIFDIENKPGISNLMTILSVVSGKSIASIQDEFAGKGYGDFKGAVADATVEYLRPMRDKALELLKDEGELIRILNNGADKARVLASKTLKDSYKALGILG
jgi:tryptophanyl-tRNA synthetase